MNGLNINLEGKTVTFRKGTLKPKYEHMRFKVTGGFGASARTGGRALFGFFEDGEQTRMEGPDVEALAEPFDTIAWRLMHPMPSGGEDPYHGEPAPSEPILSELTDS